MATDYLKETRRKSEQVAKLQKSTSQTNFRMADQLQHKFGTTRRSEIYGKIAKGEPFQKAFNDYLDTL